MGAMNFRDGYEFDPESYDGQNAGGLLGMLRAAMQQGGVLSNSGSGSNAAYDPQTYRGKQDSLIDNLRASQQQQADYQPQQPSMDPRRFELAQAITNTSQKLGIDPRDLATAISYETAGTFDPWKAGPTTQWGQHRGLIQWGEDQAEHYGVTKDSTITEQMEAVRKYLSHGGVGGPDHGSLMDIYSAINAGKIGRNDISDASNGGAPGTVADKVNTQMAGHKIKAAGLLKEYAQAIASQPYESVPAAFPDHAEAVFPQQSLAAPDFGIRTLRKIGSY